MQYGFCHVCKYPLSATGWCDVCMIKRNYTKKRRWKAA